MPKERASILRMLLGDEPGLLARFKHDLSGGTEGEWGEKCIAVLLQNWTENGDIFQNVYVPTSNGTTELDVVLLGKKGIYIFESKAYGGKIYGRPENMKWTQYLGGKKSVFYNPIKQNANHCQKLADALNIPLEYIFSIIVFENRADLSGLSTVKGDDFAICNRNDLYNMLQKQFADRSEVFSPEQILEIKNKLIEWSNLDMEQKEKHIEQVNERMFGDVCPVCGKELLERQGKYGSFMVCSGYPKCRYTRQIDKK